MKRQTLRVLTLGCLVAVAIVASGAEAALAADVRDAGENVGRTLGGWARWIFGGVTGLMATFFVIQRNYAQSIAFVIMAFIVGGFVFAPSTMGSLIRSFARLLGG